VTSHDKAVYVFDLDGVITNPEDSSVDEVVIGYINDILMRSGYVAVNTGRSYAWVGENFVQKLLAMGVSHIFDRLYIVCEKGGESRIWQGGMFVPQPSRFVLPSSTLQVVHGVFQEHQNELSTMFWDETKRTMATANLDEFHGQQEKLMQWLRTTLAGQDVKIDATTIATDVESSRAGKHAGAELIYDWVTQCTSGEYNIFICFGDSVSDYEMARYFAQQNAVTTFVYVGRPTHIPDEETRVRHVTTKALYSDGTREYLAQVM